MIRLPHRVIQYSLALLLAGVFAGSAGAQPCLRPGTLQLVWQGSMELPAGKLFNVEKDLNIIRGEASYEDGTVKSSEMHQEGWQSGFFGEWTLTPEFGIQAGADFRSLTQKVSAGGGSYEEKTWAQATLLRYDHPFIGASYYLVNYDEGYLALTGRVGTVLNGQIYPAVTNFTFLGYAPPGYTLSGTTLGAGLNASVVMGFVVLGAQFFVTDNLFRTQDKIYQDLDASFSTMSYDLQITVGIIL